MSALAPSGRRSSRDISPVVGVSLLVVIVVPLIAMIGMMVMEFRDVPFEPRPQVSFNVDYHPDGVDNGANSVYINITHEFDSLRDGSRVFVADNVNNRIAWEDVWTGGGAADLAGEYAHVDGAGSDSALKPIREVGQRYRIVIEHEDGSLSILVDCEIPAEPTSKNTAY